MDELGKKTNGQFLMCNGFSVADIAVGAMLDMMNMAETQFGLVEWLDQYPELKRY
jgi:glutathione S-transferase